MSAKKGEDTLPNHCLECFRWTVPSGEFQKRKTNISLSTSPLLKPDGNAKFLALKRVRSRMAYL